MIIAVDFDGTIVEHEYPRIGKEKPFAFYTLKKLQAEGHLLILWTSRKGTALDEAVEFCRRHGVEFYAVNKNFPEEIWDDSIARKIVADIYIDDRNLGGFPGWGEAYQMISGQMDSSHYTLPKLLKKHPIKLFFQKFLKLISD
ncbi:MAG: BT0820 family HAD-type phosphatase [Bacteroidales bacterium]